MGRIILCVLGVLHILNGFYMLVLPHAWYDAVPGVSMLGPYNTHFIRDVALIFLGSGGLFWAAVLRGVPAYALAGALWPVMHAVYHLQMWVGRGFAIDEIAFVNLAGIQLPAWLGLYAAFRLAREHGEGRS